MSWPSVRRSSWFVVCVAVASAALATARAASAAQRPNVVLIMCDDLGWGDVGFNGSQTIKTPNLDELANQGLKLTRFYAAAPVCSPTRGSCLTGRHPYRYGIYSANRGHMRPEEITVAELLREQGYRTGHFGKWHLGTLTRTVRDSNRGGPRGAAHFSPPAANGFDVCFATEAKVPTFDPMLRPPKTNNKWWDHLSPEAPAVTYGTRYWNERGEEVRDNLRGDDSKVIMDRAVTFVRQAVTDGRPFLAVIWFHAPHLPVVAGAKHAASYADFDGYQRNYYGCIAALDQQVGRLGRLLRQLDAADNTMVWFCSDNGPEGQARSAPGSAGPFRGRKRSLLEGGVRVPAFVVWPAVIAPGSSDVAAVTSDYLPTLLDVLDIELPNERPLDGISLRPVWEGRLTERPQPIGFHSAKQQSWVTQRYKLYSNDAGKTWQLYDLVNDPQEETDLAAAQPRRAAEMVAAWTTWSRSCAASDAGGDYP